MKKINLLLFIIATLLLSSCWDSVNLEERALIVGTALDLQESDEHDEPPTLSVTNQIVVPTGDGSSKANAGASAAKSFMNITSIGESIYSLDKELFAKTSKIPYYEHFLLLVISEQVAKTDNLLPKLLDTYIRDAHIRRGTKVVVAEGDAKTLLDYKSPEKQLPILLMDEMLDQNEKHAGFVKPIVLGDLEEFHLKNNSYVLPVMKLDGEIQNKAGAVFQGAKEKMVGTFNTKELQGLALMLKEAEGNIIDFSYRNETLAFEIIKLNQKTKLNTDDINKINISVQLHIDGIIKDSSSKVNYDSKEELHDVQRVINEKVTGLLKQVIDKAQKEFNADVFNIWRQLETRHYNVWEQVKDDWEQGENYFAKANFDISTDINVYSIGTSNKTN